MNNIEIVRLLLTLNIEDVKKFINKIYENKIYMLNDPFILIRILNINNKYRNKLEHYTDLIKKLEQYIRILNKIRDMIPIFIEVEYFLGI